MFVPTIIIDKVMIRVDVTMMLSVLLYSVGVDEE